MLLWGSSAPAQTVGYTTSIAGVHGTYPLDRVDGMYVFNAVDLSIGRVRASIAVPFVRLTSEPILTDPTVATAPITSTGLADPLIRVDVRMAEIRAARGQFSLAVAAKPSMVDASTGRGTGRSDYAVGGSAFGVRRRTSFLADVLYWKYGDPPEFDFPNTVSFSVGAAQLLGRGRWSASASVSGFTTGIEGLPAPLLLNVGVLTLVRGRQSLGFTASIGLNEGASDFAFGTSWRVVR